ncbi:MAG TPA: purine-binding chemotaxis protein CheW, partial [Candidatus Eisenbacteria bacterium]|nr:purine-binding chemotaxis protein CheW [Candidatus Eisenbacteria bacterium]
MSNSERTRQNIQSGIQLVTFRLGTENYGVPVSKIREIIRPMKTFPVPGLSDPVDGVINLRGEIIPVVRLHPVLGVGGSACLDDERKQRVIILDAESGGFGFLVDEVWEVVKVSASEVKPPPAMADEALDEEAIIGIIEVSGKM